MLTARLNRLVEAGILEKVAYSERPPRYEYRATPAGEELQPVLLTLMARGDRHLNADDRPVVLEHRCGAVLSPVVVRAHCGGRGRPREPALRRALTGLDDRGPRRRRHLITNTSPWGGTVRSTF
ncbi:winged helix-turn-helix transcriptional regulator [Streptomyces sp. NPDC058052]|uniref:winged helix-turn-helix transcriptional regulator n=1 Tax=Streptomyces sp. NPDC058052 TaxID=3346316 RepID=UPI0036F07FA9